MWLFDVHFSKSIDIFVFIVALLGAVHYRISIYHPIYHSHSWNHSQYSISLQFVLLAFQTDIILIKLCDLICEKDRVKKTIVRNNARLV